MGTISAVVSFKEKNTVVAAQQADSAMDLAFERKLSHFAQVRSLAQPHAPKGHRALMASDMFGLPKPQ